MGAIPKQIVRAVLAKHGPASALLLGEGGALGEVVEVIPTGLSVLDHHVLGIGGLPVGRISEVFSAEGCGKSSLALRCLAQAQREGGVAMLAETENALDPGWAQAVHGVDLGALVLLQAESMEQVTAAIETAISALPADVGPSLIAWDSLAASPTQREVDDGLAGVERIGERARHLSRACRRLGGMLKARRVHLMLVNQVRERIGIAFGDKWTTPGGHAVKFHASIRLHLMGGKAVKGDGGEHLAKDVTVLAAKNRLYPPWRRARLRLDFARGWDEQWSALALAKEQGLVETRKRGEAAYREALDKLGWKEPDHAARRE